MYDRILLPTDGTDNTRNAVEHAIDAAKRYDADLHLLYVVDESIYGAYTGDEFVHESEGVEQTLREEGEEALASVKEQAQSADVNVETAIRDGIPHEAIVEYIDNNDIELAVLGSKQQSGEYRRLLGSVSERVARLTRIPITIVKELPDQ